MYFILFSNVSNISVRNVLEPDTYRVRYVLERSYESTEQFRPGTDAQQTINARLPHLTPCKTLAPLH